MTWARQLLRSGTSIGANVSEACGALSKADFSAKISTACKESLEIKYWLKLLNDIGLLKDKDSGQLIEKCEELSKMLYTLLKKSGRIKSSQTDH